ncbi:hypothetical protein [Crassaminicella indica]|uniref:Uncharacterized protein n=1 Tax=Crassaminicella indica TaxID=2855394 RepID=A0ABX8R9N0_9CLOT|nr:hypothetical protein [Crassaminicella indica]QXM05516.1 hypothetical protein KVH43_09030 [Crassaminicella indica]
MFNDFPNYYYPWMPMYPMTPSMPMPSNHEEAMPPNNPSPITPPATQIPPNFDFEPGPPVQDDINYTQGYLKTQIGEYVKIEFLIGTNMLIDREGKLLDVGISYIVIQEPETDNYLVCDIYSIKFVEIFK